MKIAVIGPTNIEKFSRLINKPIDEIKKNSAEVGEILAKNSSGLVVVFNYSGMLKLVGDSYRKNGGKLEMLYTENDYDWETKIYMKHLEEADKKTKKDSWHDMLLSLVADNDVVVCAGLGAGVLAELCYIKWNFQEKKGKLRALIGVKEFLRNGEFPQEISYDLDKLIKIVEIKELGKVLKKFSPQ